MTFHEEIQAHLYIAFNYDVYVGIRVQCKKYNNI